MSRILPGKLWLSSLEAPVVQHCNLRCAACNAASPQLPKASVSPDQLKADLEKLSQQVRVGEFRILGGEPLLHPNLADIIAVVRRSKISSRICLITNGVLIHKLDPVIWQSLDRLWVSFYPGIRTGLPRAEISKRCYEYGVKFTPVTKDYFQRKLLTDYNGDEKLVKNIFQTCNQAWRWRCYTVLNGYFFRCATAPQTKIRLALAGRDYPGYHIDGVDIQDQRNLRRRLKEYAFSKKPLGACHYCLGHSGKLMPHVQLGK